MAKGYSARGGFSGGGSAMRQQQMQQKLLKMQQDMAAAQEAVENASFTASVGGGVVQASFPRWIHSPAYRSLLA